ncbi:MAG: L-seryl-tRNA(Sec) selenium transferase [Acidobacteriota bacterium]|nr:L-seryl-tRNA(Sec) selenium transferase [Acidobacteriota bacterium]
MKSAPNFELYRKLPSVDDLARRDDLKDLVAHEGQPAVTDAAREVLSRLRQEIAAQQLDDDNLDMALSGIVAAIQRQVRQSLSYSLRSVINATGVILHTNFGRAPLSPSAIDAVRNIACTYSNLEFDLDSGKRGKRDVHVERLFRKLLDENLPSKLESRDEKDSPNISTIVVNNNAAAVLLALNTLAEGGEVIVSRGELVEIGGSFRVPDVMSKSNAILREVGTTNRTRISDYANAINEKTKLLLRVHRSNFQITGFTEQPELRDLVELANKSNVPLMEDLGSGALFDLRTIGIGDEPNVFDSLRSGVQVVAYSGDKLLGGPQAGILTGRSDLIERMRANSLFRALRVDKLTYAAFEATLLAYVKHDYDSIPALRMMHLSKDSVGERARAVAAKVQSQALAAEVIDGESILGGGATPSATLPTRLLAISSREMSADQLSARLRACPLPIICRVEDGRVLLDLRTVLPDQDKIVIEGLRTLFTKANSQPADHHS